MTPRVSPTEQLRAEIDDLFEESDEQRQLGDTLEEVARLGARLLLQTAQEAEVAEFLCRNRYERRKAARVRADWTCSDVRASRRSGVQTRSSTCDRRTRDRVSLGHHPCRVQPHRIERSPSVTHLQRHRNDPQNLRQRRHRNIWSRSCRS